ncbi:hypothetical protein [Parendozoicomonas haliclonae]|uniref:Flagellar biosynthesis protein, FliO n=1 Tax=Parendozoicomonas haliclonae TaxID=1960125 RepID=A0A1X7AP39_9GAMM|nr:hypothetical protein [Parendozoicomonas haliclonae]SMA49892.1 hypothetical protein EHSB41UT_03683 [Parendozoicomonas haliclonae]
MTQLNKRQWFVQPLPCIRRWLMMGILTVSSSVVLASGQAPGFKPEPEFSSRFLWSYGLLMLALVLIAAGLWYIRQRQIHRLRQATGQVALLECLDSRRLDSATTCWLVKAGDSTVLVTSNGKQLSTQVLPLSRGPASLSKEESHVP